ncbi:MAG TPA: 4Fe-4S dicluster domain-containing protein, partial [Bacteroidota bacterium]
MNSTAEHDLVERIRKYGRFDANGCMNCGTCSIVCDLSAGEASFPRRPLQRALLGLKRSLVGGLEPWLCNDCGDCSRHCPRQAEPRESLMTLRRYLAGQYDVTGISARILRSGAVHVGTLIGAALLFLAVAAAYHLYIVEIAPADLLSTDMGLEHMFGLITDVTRVVFLLPLAVMLVNILNMYRLTMRGE